MIDVARKSSSTEKPTDPNTGRAMSVETRAKISAALRGRTQSPEHRARNSAAQMGWIATPETRAKMSASRKGKPVLDALDPKPVAS